MQFWNWILRTRNSYIPFNYFFLLKEDEKNVKVMSNITPLAYLFLFFFFEIIKRVLTYVRLVVVKNKKMHTPEVHGLVVNAR